MRRRFPLLSLIGAVFIAAPLHAQADTSVTTDVRWRPYLGCWNATGSGSVNVVLTCVTPTRDSSSVTILSFRGDTVIERKTIAANGERTRTEQNGCRGWDRAAWSKDGRRIFLSSETVCGGVAARSTGVMAFQTQTEDGTESFVSIDVVRMQTDSAVRIVTLRPLPAATPMPAVLRALHAGMWSAAGRTARWRAAATPSRAAVTDIALSVAPRVVEVWLANRREVLRINGRELLAMRRDSVPTTVLDMVVAVSNPRDFVVERPRPVQRPVDVLPSATATDMNAIASLARPLDWLAVSNASVGFSTLRNSLDLFGRLAWAGDPYFNTIPVGNERFLMLFGGSPFSALALYEAETIANSGFSVTLGGGGAWYAGNSPIVASRGDAILVNGFGYSFGGGPAFGELGGAGAGVSGASTSGGEGMSGSGTSGGASGGGGRTAVERP
jgi:hypothetical protein